MTPVIGTNLDICRRRLAHEARAPFFSARPRCTVASYFACTGQIGNAARISAAGRPLATSDRIAALGRGTHLVFRCWRARSQMFCPEMSAGSRAADRRPSAATQTFRWNLRQPRSPVPPDCKTARALCKSDRPVRAATVRTVQAKIVGKETQRQCLANATWYRLRP